MDTRFTTLPPLFEPQNRPGLELVGHVRGALAAAGLPRTSTMNGAALAGLIPPNHGGSTGFSVKIVGANRLEFNVVVSGTPHLRYIHHHDGGYEPAQPERLLPG